MRPEIGFSYGWHRNYSFVRCLSRPMMGLDYPIGKKAMTSIATRAVSAAASAWRRHQRKRMQQSALSTIIRRKNDHLRKDVGLAADDDLPWPQRKEAERLFRAATNCRRL